MGGAVGTALDDALALVASAVDHPLDVRARAHTMAQAGDTDSETRVVALRALGLAHLHTDEVPQARTCLGQALELALSNGLRQRAAQVRFSYALCLMYSGELPQALEQIDQAASELDDGELPTAMVQRGLIRLRMGQLEEGIDEFNRAQPLLQEQGNWDWEARLLNNRGLARAYRNDYGGAATDMRAAEVLLADHGLELRSGRARHNRGFIAARHGDVPLALRLYAEGDEVLVRHGVSNAVGNLDAVETMARAGLLEEAYELAGRVVHQLEASGMAADLAEAQLALASCAVELGDSEGGLQAAELARDAFVQQSRDNWALVCEHVALRARFALAQDVDLEQTAERLAAKLDHAGWTGEAAESRLVAAQIALARGDVAAATTYLSKLPEQRALGSMRVRMAGWHATALLQIASGKPERAEHALAAGMKIVDDYRETLGATELRTHASRYGQDLAELGLRLALERGDATAVMHAVERWRAASLRTAPARPPQDPQFASALAALRAINSDLDEALLAGQPTADLRRQQSELEERISVSSRQVSRRSQVGEDEIMSPLDALGSRALVELFLHDGQIGVLTSVDGHLQLASAVSLATASRALEDLRFGLRRVVDPGRSGPSRNAAHRSVQQSADALDNMLFGAVADTIGGRDVVLSPVGLLHAAPWALLPTLSGVNLTVAPSSSIWAKAMARTRHADGSVVVAAGPELAHAEQEAESVARYHKGCTVLRGKMASAQDLLRHLDGADLGHIAAHGRFRRDNPLFSSLRMADGPLWVYDLESLASPPFRLVLSACESGRMSVHAGDELMGLTGSLMAIGTSTVVASVMAVPDEATAIVMEQFHAGLSNGLSSSESLCTVRQRLLAQDDVLLAGSAAAFVCFGSGR